MFVSVCQQCQQVHHGGEDVCLCVSKFITVVKMFVSVCEQVYHGGENVCLCV